MDAIKQTVEIPANRRLTIEVPNEVPTGKTILSFKPVAKADNFSIKKLRGTLHKIDFSDLREESDRQL